MNVCRYLVVLFCMVGLGIHVSESSPPTSNPECTGMNTIAKRLDKGIKTFTKETTNCRVNNACTGLMCNGTHKKNDFYMKMELKHCKTPPEIHLDLIYKYIKFHKELKKGSYKISKSNLGPNVELKLKLNKNRNKVTAGLKIQMCAAIHPIKIGCKTFTLLPQTKFCLNMKACPGYNSTGDEPCHLNPTGITSVSSTSVTQLRTTSTVMTEKVSTKRTSATLKPRSHSSTQHSVTQLRTTSTVMTEKVSTKRTSATLKPRSHSSTQHSVTTTVVEPSSPRAEKRGSGHHHITAAVAAGIGLACLTAVLIMVAAAYYWKRFYRRSRLRAAYYNDISMNDPLYEDFGPEEA